MKTITQSTMVKLTQKLFALTLIVSIATVCGSEVRAQSNNSSNNTTKTTPVKKSAPPRTNSSSRRNSSRRIPPSRTVRKKPSTTKSGARRTPTTSGKKTSSSKPSTSPVKKSGDKKEENKAEEEKGFFGKVVQYAKQNMVMVISVASGCLGLILLVMMLGRRKKADLRDDNYEMVPLGSNFQEDEDAPRKVLIDPKTGKPRTLPKKDDSEYALVVEEDVLHGDELDSTHEEANNQFEDLVRDGNFDSAYRKYEKNLVASGEDPVHSEAERALSFHYLQNGDLQKAENILTHHLRTQTRDTIDATAYFDMAYLAFKNKKYNQSRDFFKRYVEVGDDPKLSERAQQVIKKLDTIQ